MCFKASHWHVYFLLILLTLCARDAASFIVGIRWNGPLVWVQMNRVQISTTNHPIVWNTDSCRNSGICRKRRKHSGVMSPSALSLLLDVPDDFFTITFPMLGILLSISKNFARIRMEERAWEQRLEDGREDYLSRNPLVTELDLRKKEAAQEWSAYGVPRKQEEAAAQRYQYDEQRQKDDRRRSRVSVMDRDDVTDNDYGMDNTKSPQRIRKEDYCMTDEEIEIFEAENGVLYDPYYDDPYYVEELPEGKYEIDKIYGDRIYPNGEIFYKDGKSGLYYRQGSKPRNLSFFG
jgi:hypothetical protein